MKKVLHIITGLGDGGAEGVLTRLCLLSKGVEHEVISLMDEGKYGNTLTDAGVKVTCLRMNPAKPNPFKFLKLLLIIRKIKPDVVQTWMYHADLLGGLAAKITGVKKIVWNLRHSTLDKGKAKRSTILIAKLCARLSLVVPTKIICCAYKALSVHADLGYKKSKMQVISNGYDLARFKPDETLRSCVRNELNIEKSIFLVGKVGRYDPFKDHSNLLKALSVVKSSNIDFLCVLVGKGLDDENYALNDEISRLGLKKNIVLLGQRTDVPAIMNAIDLHVLASASEAFPNVLAEAMACGAVCVSTNVGDAAEILDMPELICEPQDHQALAKLILHSYSLWKSSPVDWDKLKNKNIKRIEDNYSIQNMIKSYEQCWLG